MPARSRRRKPSQLIQLDPRVKLVDVRTNAERDWVGKVAMPEAQHVAVEWNTWPGGTPESRFVAATGAAGQQGRRAAVPVPLGRALAPWRAARPPQHGYAQAYDILEGFEGDKDSEGHRKTVGGWCKAGLPWTGA